MMPDTVGSRQVLTAHPVALGFAGFSLTLLILSIANAKGGSTGLVTAAAASALPYGGVVLLLASMWAFWRGETFVATALGSYGGFWVTFFLLVRVFPAGAANGDHGFAWWLVGWSIFTTYMLVATLRLNVAVFVTFLALTVALWLLSVGAFTETEGWTKAGGWAGIVTSAAGWYVSFALVLNETVGKTVLPLGPPPLAERASARPAAGMRPPAGNAS